MTRLVNYDLRVFIRLAREVCLKLGQYSVGVIYRQNLNPRACTSKNYTAALNIGNQTKNKFVPEFFSPYNKVWPL